jgi:hypothetical protein
MKQQRPTMIRVAFHAAMMLGCALAQAAPDTRSFRTPTFSLVLRADTQTLVSLAPVGERDFDFLPVNRAAERRDAGHYHLGDLTLRVRTDNGEWRDFSTNDARIPVRTLPTEGDTLAAADITTSLGTGSPLRVERRWRKDGRSLVLSFTLTNVANAPVEIGALGFPLPFDNILNGRSLEQAHSRASFADPSIANDAGYVQVTRLNGHGPVLLVLPEGRTPLEAWRPLEDKLRRGQTFEGFFEWMVASRAYAEREWRNADEQWNPPTSFTLAPGESRRVGLRFVQSPSIRTIETTLIAERQPVAIGIPGYVVSPDLAASLFLSSPSAVSRLEVEPAGALIVEKTGNANGWERVSVRGVKWGRARLAIDYADGTSQTVSYFVIKPAAEVVRDLGAFATREQFFDAADDPFGRAPSILSYDRETDRIVTQDTRAWIAGMSDEGGAGSWVAAMLKQLDNPVPGEVERLERIVDETVWGKLQVADGKQAGGVKKSLFYYEPKRFPGYYDAASDWSTWTSWNEKHAADLGRSYNYPHVAAGHWVLYRLARHRTGLVRRHDWRWYLERAALTARAMVRDAPHYAQFGQMEGEVFLEILRDLEREGMTREARSLETLMKKRADHWLTLPYPFGSEMPWDSTGQPEVYAWMRHFGHERQASMTREVILGYDPAIPSWGYNGNARRYWDFLYGGKIRRIERQIHHYGSALNAVPLFDAYRANPEDFHLLRVAYGGLMGALTNIDQRGFGSAAFHSWPDEMRFDALTGDYGMGFFGHAYATASYLVKHPTFGWLGFGGNVTQTGDIVRLEPRDSARARVFIAPARLWVTLAAGKIEAADYSTADGSVTLRLAPADAHTPAARLSLETGDTSPPIALPGAVLERGMFTIPLAAEPTFVKIPRSS